jgi:ribosomal protein L40E
MGKTMNTERFKFNAKPGEAGFKELKQNKYGHTVLNPNEEDGSNDNVKFTIDPETGIPRADLSIWDTQKMRDLATKLNLPLDTQEDKEEIKESKLAASVITDKDMDELLQNIDNDLVSDETSVDSHRVVYSSSETNLQTQDNRVRKVSKNSIESDNQPTKICTDESCGATLPFSAKFCSACGKLQKVTLFCIEC